MVDKVSIAGNVREIEPAPVRRDAVSPSGRPQIAQDKLVGAFVDKFYGAMSSELTRQSPTEEMAKLREFLREKRLTLLDRSV